MATESITITPGTAKRLISDIISIRKNPLTDQGIYYEHDEDNMLTGYAMIVGPSDTPYAYGYFFFKFTFPSDYPFSPPIVKYCTQNSINRTRFNPNLYRNGKVCISILNTWQGDPWSGCQTISSVLLTLCTLFTKKPLLNEPGVHPYHSDIDPYSKIISYETIATAIIKMSDETYRPMIFNRFRDDIIKLNKVNRTNIQANIDNIKQTHHNGKLITCSFYSMKCTILYDKIQLCDD